MKILLLLFKNKNKNYAQKRLFLKIEHDILNLR